MSSIPLLYQIYMIENIRFILALIQFHLHYICTYTYDLSKRSIVCLKPTFQIFSNDNKSIKGYNLLIEELEKIHSDRLFHFKDSQCSYFIIKFVCTS